MDKRKATAENLARLHYEHQDSITSIYRIESEREGESDPVKLLEVNATTMPSGIVPLRFDPAPTRGIHYPVVVVEVTPAEYEQIRARKLRLPAGWQVGDVIQRTARRRSGQRNGR